MILINTGDGKGKTTAALGIALRALGYGKRVAMVQFVKGPWKSGEDFFAKECKIPQSKFKVIKTGKGFVGILGDTLPIVEHRQSAEEGFLQAEKLIKAKKYDLVILDEINVAIYLKLLNVRRVVKLLTSLPEGIDVILTGRNAPQELLALADTVTEMKEVKHAFNKNLPPKKGIDF